jgi:hypothetical protein
MFARMVESRVPPNQGGRLVRAALRAASAFSLAFLLGGVQGSGLATAHEGLTVAATDTETSITDSLYDPMAQLSI